MNSTATNTRPRPTVQDIESPLFQALDEVMVDHPVWGQVTSGGELHEHDYVRFVEDVYTALVRKGVDEGVEVKTCRVCSEPVVFVPFVGWTHMTPEQIDHDPEVG